MPSDCVSLVHSFIHSIVHAGCVGVCTLVLGCILLLVLLCWLIVPCLVESTKNISISVLILELAVDVVR